MPKLKDGQYSLSIGFPKSDWPEQNMICTIDSKDLGFLLKNFGDKGWGLFNMQTMDIVMAGNKPKAISAAVQTKTDDFSNMLSNVVNDPSIKQVDPIKEPEKALVKSELVNAIETSSVDSSAVANPVKANTEAAKSSVTRTLLNKNSDGTEMMFIDEVEGKKDTVRIFIPADKKPAEQVKAPVDEKKETIETKQANSNPAPENNASIIDKSTRENNLLNEPKDAAIKEPVKNENRPAEKKFIEMDLPVKDTNVKSEKKMDEQVVGKKAEVNAENSINEEKKATIITTQSPMINSDCKSSATEEDFMKLRKKMVGEDNDDDMIAQAKKTFKNKCFTVDQVKNLSVLFLKDVGKYNFFDMAYPFVSDSHNFINLQSQLSDSYYINRFQVMIRH
ncbi:MAG: DUF4476 domain-containing protein [Ferruginibacter sp.]